MRNHRAYFLLKELSVTAKRGRERERERERERAQSTMEISENLKHEQLESKIMRRDRILKASM